MSRWFRHYAGMMRDEKLVRAAVKAKQPVERVVWVWGAILESAAEVNDGGRYEFDTGEAAYFLRCDEAELVSIVDCLGHLGRVSDGVVVRWGDRQYASDSAAERQRRYRERKAGNRVPQDDGDAGGDAQSDVTPPSRDGQVTPQETETEAETERENKPPASVSRPGARDLFDEVWSAFPQNPSSVESRAEAAFRATKAKDQQAILAAARRYAIWFGQDCEARKRTRDAGLRFVPHLSTWIETGAWKQAESLPVKGEAGEAVIPMTKLDRERDRELWQACEKVMGKKAPTSGFEWTFRNDVIDQARKELAH